MTNIYFRLGEQPINQEPFHYKISGLDNIYLQNGFLIETDEDGDECVSFEAMDELHVSIARHLMTQTILSGKELRFLRKRMSMTQDAIAKLMGVSSQTYARWEKDVNPIGGPAEKFFRVIYLDHWVDVDLNETFSGYFNTLAEIEDQEGKDDIINVSEEGAWRHAM